MQNILEARHLIKYFYNPKKVKVIDDVSFSIKKGEFVSIVGKSGCGKSTLLYLLSTMDTAFEGELLIDGVSTKGKSEAQLAEIRNQKIGFVFQFHYLLNEFNVLQNVMLPALKLGRYSHEEIEGRAIKLLKLLGIDYISLQPSNLISGGEKQRVAIARALINEPHIIIGDEPTGNLDKRNSDIVFNLFHKLSEEMGQTMLIVTHDSDFASRTKRTILMEDGKIMNETSA